MQSDSTIDDELFKTGQVQLGCWQALIPRGSSDHQAHPSGPFKSRFNRLFTLELKPEKPGRGTDARWTLFDACAMAFGLELWDRSFNPDDIKWIIEHSRPWLREAFDHVMRNCLPPGRSWSLRDRPSLPPRLWLPGDEGTLGEEQRQRQADTSTWLTFRGHAQREMYEGHSRLERFYTQPKLFIGLHDLVEHLAILAVQHKNRGEDLFELSGLFGHTIERTRAAPATRRGRQ